MQQKKTKTVSASTLKSPISPATTGLAELAEAKVTIIALARIMAISSVRVKIFFQSGNFLVLCMAAGEGEVLVLWSGAKGWIYSLASIFLLSWC